MINNILTITLAVAYSVCIPDSLGSSGSEPGEYGLRNRKHLPAKIPPATTETNSRPVPSGLTSTEHQFLKYCLTHHQSCDIGGLRITSDGIVKNYESPFEAFKNYCKIWFHVPDHLIQPMYQEAVERSRTDEGH